MGAAGVCDFTVAMLMRIPEIPELCMRVGIPAWVALQLKSY